MVRLERCLVGGTFDRFHAGHIALLEAALAEAELVEVWIAGHRCDHRETARPIRLRG